MNQVIGAEMYSKLSSLLLTSLTAFAGNISKLESLLYIHLQAAVV
jgi:hypothetical protein